MTFDSSKYFLDEGGAGIDSSKYFIDETPSMLGGDQAEITIGRPVKEYGWMDSLMSGVPGAKEVSAAGTAAGNVLKKGLDYILPGPDQADPRSWSDVYNDARLEGKIGQAEYSEKHPVASKVLPLVGSLAIAKSPGAAPKATLGTLTKQGAIIGGTYGYAGGEGGVENRAKSGILGLLLGAAAPPILVGGARGVGATYNATKNFVAPLFSKKAAETAAERGAMDIVSRFADTKQVGRDLLAEITTQEAKPAIQQSAYTNLDKFKTTAEVVGRENKAGLATLQDMLTRTGSPETKLQATAFADARERARIEIIRRLEGGTPVTEEEAAEILRASLSKNLEGMQTAVGQAAERAKNPDDIVNIWSAKKSISDVERDLTRSGAYKPSAEIQGFIDEFRQLPKQVSLQTLQDWRSRAGQLGQSLTDKRDQALAKALFSAASTAEETAVAAGTVSKSTASALQEMRELRAQQGVLFEEGGTGKLLDKKFGKYTADPQSAVPKLTASPTEATRTVNALGADKGAKETLAQNFITRARETILTGDQTAILPQKFQRFVLQNKGIAETVGGRRYANSLQIIADDLASQGQVKAAAEWISKGQSISPQAITNAIALKGAIKAAAGKIGGRIPILGSLAKVVGKDITARRESLIEQKLIEFIMQPKVAQRMIETATDQSVRELSGAFAAFLSGGTTRLSSSGIGKAVTIEDSPGPLFSESGDHESDRQKQDGNGDNNQANRSNNPQGLFSPKGGKSDLFAPTSNSDSLFSLKQPKIVSAKRGSYMDKPSEAAASLVKAVIQQESGGRSSAVSPKGATGKMQIMPDTWREWAPKVGVSLTAIKDPEANVKVGAAYLNYLINRYGDERLALAAYNAGLGNVDEWIADYGTRDWDEISARLEADKKFKETRDYVPSVLKKADYLEA